MFFKKNQFLFCSVALLLLFCNKSVICSEEPNSELVVSDDIAEVVEYMTPVLDAYDVEPQVINTFGLSQQDCDTIISFLKQKKPEETVGRQVASIAKVTLKDGLYFGSSVLVGMLIGAMMLKGRPDMLPSDVLSNVNLMLASGVSMIASYVLIKGIETLVFTDKSEEEFLIQLINEIREISDVVE